jgi:hypothetical protein
MPKFCQTLLAVKEHDSQMNVVARLGLLTRHVAGVVTIPHFTPPKYHHPAPQDTPKSKNNYSISIWVKGFIFCSEIRQDAVVPMMAIVDNTVSVYVEAWTSA